MNSASMALPTKFSRRWLWPLIYLLAGLTVTSPVAVACAAVAYFAISSGVENSIAEVAIAAGAGLLVGIWLWLTWFTVRLFVYRKSPLVILEDDGVEIPHARPPFIAWHQIALVEQIKSGRVTYLRLQLVSPNEQLSRWQRLIKWPYSDSILVTLGANRSATLDPAFLAVQAKHAAHSNDWRDGSNEQR